MTGDDCCGFGVYVGGSLVAWFPEFGQKEQEWCTENFFGQWLIWKASKPEPLPLTEEEKKEADARLPTWRNTPNNREGGE